MMELGDQRNPCSFLTLQILTHLERNLFLRKLGRHASSVGAKATPQPAKPASARSSFVPVGFL